MLHSDLLYEDFAKENTIEKKENIGTASISRIDLNEELAKKYKRLPGVYYTIFSDAILKIEKRRYDDLHKALAKIIKEFINMYKIKKEDSVFIVGLGNADVTPDSLGPKVIDMLLVTKHLEKINQLEPNMQSVIALAPGVMSQTGIESVDIVSSVVKKEKPKLVIVIDALAARSMKRLNQTIQITNTAIAPGSGIGNFRKEFSKATLGTNVLCIGVPTVVDIRSALVELGQEFFNNKDTIKPFSIEDEKIQFMVTPKEVDQNIIDLAHIISNGLNLALHNRNF